MFYGRTCELLSSLCEFVVLCEYVMCNDLILYLSDDLCLWICICEILCCGMV
jgi:hypothetical protein